MRRPHLVLFLTLIALASAPVYGAAPGTISGVVRDSQGVAQIGAVVELLRPDLSVISSVFTDSMGHYKLPSVLPGRYAVKAMGAAFLPSLREDVRVRSSAVVNLTLNTLYEVVQWLPAEPRSSNAQQDDWKWTLRAAANRPLLRWLEDGPLVVVSDGSGSSPKLKARLIATGQQGSFGESGERVSAAVEETPAENRELLAQVDFDPNTVAGLESTLGFRQDLGFAGSVESLAAVAIHPEVNSAGSEGLDEAAMRTLETIHLGDMLEAEAGSSEVVARFAANSPNTIVAALPFASVAWRNGDSTVSYRMASALPPETNGEGSGAEIPAVSMRNGRLALEHGLHQEIGWERGTGNSDVALLVYADKIDNPVLEAMGNPAAGNAGADASGAALYDAGSGLMRAAGPGFNSVGMQATVRHTLTRASQIRVSYANGSALVLASAQPGGQAIGLGQLLASAHARRAQSYSISLSGTLDGSGTRWRATYRWQPEETLTPVASFASDAADPYLNLQLRQPLRLRRAGSDGVGGFEVLVNLRNLLAEGYRPYLLSDGSLVVFAQDQRSFSGGVAFNF
jgi:Carboxypeptidase regulatory-like domain